MCNGLDLNIFILSANTPPLAWALGEAKIEVSV